LLIGVPTLDLPPVSEKFSGHNQNVSLSVRPEAVSIRLVTGVAEIESNHARGTLERADR
jgi:hypothetical protein